MIKGKKILSIIPARGGSKGVLRKNVKLLCGKPLIHYTIKASLDSTYIDRVAVSTDDQEIADIAKNYPVEIIKRPAILAKDDTKAFYVYHHVLEHLKENEDYEPDILVILQPTSPLRESKDIDESIMLFVNNPCDSVISINEDDKIYWSMRIKDNVLDPVFDKDFLSNNRQDLPKLYKPNGAIFVSTPEKMMQNKGFYGGKIIPYVMPLKRSIDIDTDIDFELANIIMEKRESL